MPFASRPETLVRQHHAIWEPEPGSGSCHLDGSVRGAVYSMPSARRNSTPSASRRPEHLVGRCDAREESGLDLDFASLITWYVVMSTQCRLLERI